MLRREQPIGLFDSGIGGLSVARCVMQELPNENTVYFGDSARVPYGSKSTETVRFYSRQALAFLESKDVKLIIVACNTASAVALETMRTYASVPVLGVIEPGAAAAAAATLNGHIGVIGTEGTVRSKAYEKAMLAHNDGLTITSRSCPLFVGFAEEGLSHHPATLIMTREYLADLLADGIDTLIMGCTHYPILEPSIAEVAGPNVRLIDPGFATALSARALLAEQDLLNDSSLVPRHEYYLSDLPHKFVEIGERFLRNRIEHVTKISLEELGEKLEVRS